MSIYHSINYCLVSSPGTQAEYPQAEHAGQLGHYSKSFGHLHFVMSGPYSLVTVAHGYQKKLLELPTCSWFVQE